MSGAPGVGEGVNGAPGVGDGVSGVPRTGDRMTGLWLRAYPRRWRAVRGAEVRALLADLGPLSVGDVLGLVRGGIGTRWRTRPPWRVVAAYRLRSRRPAARYDAWLRDDLDGVLYAARAMVWLLPPFVAVLAALQPWLGLVTPGSALFGIVLMAVSEELSRRRLRAEYFRAAPDEVGHFQPYRGMTR